MTGKNGNGQHKLIYIVMALLVGNLLVSWASYSSVNDRVVRNTERLKMDDELRREVRQFMRKEVTDRRNSFQQLRRELSNTNRKLAGVEARVK